VKDPHEVEHVMADKPERYVPDVYPNEHVFAEERNRLGALLLVPKSFNASYGALPYKDKRPHYNSQNLLARTFTDEGYDHNPKFLGYWERSGLPFESVAEFGKDALQGRQALYRDLAAEVWSVERFELKGSASAGAAAA